MPRLAVSIGAATEAAKAKAKRERGDVLVVRASKMGRYGIRERFHSVYCAGVTSIEDSLVDLPIRMLVLVVEPNGTVTPAGVARGAAIAARARAQAAAVSGGY